MPLSSAEEISLFEILEIPYANSYTMVEGVGTISVTFLMTAKTTVQAWIAALDAASITRLQSNISRWDTIGTTPLRMDGGSVGAISGLTLDYDGERKKIKDRVLNIVPFFRYHEVLAKSESGGGFNVRICR
jgi:hypothetical protein